MKKIPEIRFKGFSEEWEEKELGEIGKFFSGGTPLTSNKSYYDGNIPFIGSGNINDEKVTQFINEEALKNSSAKLVYKGDLLYALYGATSGEVAISKLNGAINQAVLCIRSNENIYFLYQYLKLNKENIISTYLQGGQGNLSATIIKALKLKIPKQAEQQKIGKLFKNIDNLILAQEKKYKKLENIKKAFLEKLFPNDDKKIPEIRFKKFSEEWEEKKIKDIFDYIRPDNYIVKSTKYSNKYRTPVLTANKAFILGFTNENNTFNQKSIIFDDFTLDFKYVDFPYMLKSSAIKILVIKNEKLHNLEFVYNLLKTIEIEIMGHARHYIGVVQNIIVYIPSIQEQQKIGKLFKNLDKLLDLHKQKLNKLKQIKQAMLDKILI